eukprot:scaffold15223_cov18-Tisochrysis_lutea.AAC.1
MRLLPGCWFLRLYSYASFQWLCPSPEGTSSLDDPISNRPETTQLTKEPCPGRSILGRGHPPQPPVNSQQSPASAAVRPTQSPKKKRAFLKSSIIGLKEQIVAVRSISR